MALEWAKLVEFFHEKAQYWYAAWLVIGVAAFAPSRYLLPLGLDVARNQHRPVLVGIFLLATIYVLGHVGGRVSRWWSHRHDAANEMKRLTGVLKKLSVEEKQILCGYILGKTKTQYFGVNDGVVQGLADQHLIYRSSNLGAHGVAFAFNIQPWAWDHLNEHPEVITEGVPRAANGAVIGYEP